MMALIPPIAFASNNLAESPTKDMIVGSESGPYRRLFLDALAIEKQSGIQRIFHQCEKYKGNPVITADTPWEIGGSGPYLYGTVMWDQNKLHLWYHFIQGGYRNAYAESIDGIHWTKPKLGIIEYNNSKENNMFITVTQDPDENPPRKNRGQCHNPNVIVRPWIENQQERYVLFCYGADYDKVRVAFSHDGLHWKFVPETAKNGLFESSDVVNFFYDLYQNRYVATWTDPLVSLYQRMCLAGKSWRKIPYSQQTIWTHQPRKSMECLYFLTKVFI